MNRPLLTSSKEPVLNKGWWKTLVIFLCIVTFGQIVIRPGVIAVHAYLMDVTSP